MDNCESNCTDHSTIDELFNLINVKDWARDNNITLRFSPTQFFYEMTLDRVVVASIYILLFVVGTVGNLAVIFVITSLLCNARKQPSCTGLIRIFVVSLSFVDILILLQLLVVFADICSTQWLFGLGLCRLFWATDSFYKMTSSFLLFGISANNYLAACHSVLYRKIATPKFAIAFATGVSLLAILLTAPIIPFVSINYTGKLEAEGNVFEVLSEKCIFQPPETLLKSYLSYVFLLHYCIPLVAQIKFNASMISALERSQISARRHTAALNRAKRAVVPLISFYFICWTPYWLINWCLVVVGNSVISANESVRVVLSVLMYFLHSLPYFHAAINPCLYSWLYKSIGQAYKKSLPKSTFLAGSKASKGSTKNRHSNDLH